MKALSDQHAGVHVVSLDGPETGKDSTELTISGISTQETNSGQFNMTSVSNQPNKLKLIFCFLGIFVCYFFYGILQEKM